MENRISISLIFFVLTGVSIPVTIDAQGRYGSELPEGTITSLTSKRGYLYSGIDNYIQIDNSLVSACDTVLITTSNGIVVPDTLNRYILIPERSGTARLSLKCLNANDTLMSGYCFLIVNNVPDPFMTLNNQPIGTPIILSKAVFLSCDSLGVYFGDDIYGSEDWIRIIDFTIGYNYGGFHISHINNSNKITAETKELVTRLGPDHEISILFGIETQGEVRKQLPIYRITLY